MCYTRGSGPDFFVAGNGHRFGCVPGLRTEVTVWWRCCDDRCVDAESGGFRNPANDKDFFWSYYSDLTRPHPKIFLGNLGCCFIAIWPDILSFFKTFECGFSFVVLCLSKAPSLNQRMWPSQFQQSFPKLLVPELDDETHQEGNTSTVVDFSLPSSYTKGYLLTYDFKS